MKLVFVLFFMMCPYLIYAQQNKNISSSTSVYNEEGKLQMLIAYNPSCSCRTYTEYYTDGKIFAKRIFKITDKKEFIDGEDVTYYHDGSIKIYKLWKNAVPDGRAYAMYENGKLEHEEFYANKLKTGTWKYYNKKGELIREQKYVPGKNVWNTKKDFVTVNYYENGKFVYTEVYEEGKKIRSTESKVKSLNTATEAITDGKALFALKCSACHTADKDGYGPALKNVTKKRKEEWLFMIIKNGMQLVKDGDKDAVELYNTWRKKKHPDLQNLSNKQVQAIINYLKTMK